MIASVVNLDISTEQWLEYAFMAIPHFIITAIVIILVTLLLSFVIAIGWGLCWNKKWSLGKNARWFTVGVIALVAAACLAARDSLCGGGFGSFTGESSKVTAAFDGKPIDVVEYPEAKSANDVAKEYTSLFPDQPQNRGIDGIDGEDEDDTNNAPILLDDSDDDTGDEDELSDSKTKYAIQETSRAPYETCDSLLTYVSLFCILLLLIVIPWVSYRDIRLIYPVPADDNK